MTKEIKAFRIAEMQVKAADDGSHTISGYGSTFGGEPDSYGDIVSAGAFAASLKERMPKMLYQHRSDQLAGVWTKAYEDTKGLYLEGKFLTTPIGNQAYEECKAGALDSMSIGYSTIQSAWNDDTNIRTLIELKLWEVSLVTFPANENAIITNVKEALPDNVRDFEKFLREAGFSREKAKIIAARGFKAADDQREAEPDLKAIHDQLIAFTHSIKELYVQ
ncbi:MAG: HK97 family phage prohead protease [Acetobacteraceae bacterium]